MTVIQELEHSFFRGHEFYISVQTNNVDMHTAALLFLHTFGFVLILQCSKIKAEIRLFSTGEYV